ncbi:hypothetical protein COU77_00160 [Candidatus Peregrinibacteria bacterium CG10_big_fil_rev_8_21_14_0_10_49_16]|nr:MAG: hypothetical protein COW95_04775 [Candidatus Peregrinibacteria bacterium CG22_combo_CG10-13_8_21_14_all_49_11]PIR52474.1 MAG: hypothetical protein COU77_00160 [Candidatus Peregrinibacteria bacterium CG10_big_fil_rev_8_21_14_0_10_49_16]
MITLQPAADRKLWNAFIASQPFSPFLQSWEMGEVYREIGQEPVRLEIREGVELIGVCFGHVVPARRGRHLSIPYGPVLAENCKKETISELMKTLKNIASDHSCSFIRMSPFWPFASTQSDTLRQVRSLPSPLHLLAEHLWLLDLQNKTEEDILKNMRKNTRNLIRRAEREDVTIHASDDPLRDLHIFLALHEETRRRHAFTPYTNTFFEAQVRHFYKRKGSLRDPTCTLYIATYDNEPIASSIHIHFGGETSYHHGASTHKHAKIPASYLLQWTALQDALKRGDHLYNFWGIAAEGAKSHPFSGVTTFKTGFGGELYELIHCIDIPLTSSYYLTRGFETIRKWKRGF